MKILREVKCSERLPVKEERYFIKSKNDKFRTTEYFNGKRFEVNEEFDPVESWYEEVDLDLKSEEILPLNERGLDVCECTKDIEIQLKESLEALEAAELEIAVSKHDYDELLRRYENERTINSKLIKTSSKTIIEAYEAKFLEMEKIKDDNYKKAIKALTKALKIAAGINE